MAPPSSVSIHLYLSLHYDTSTSLYLYTPVYSIPLHFLSLSVYYDKRKFCSRATDTAATTYSPRRVIGE
jgi:hypothetical protein